MSMALPSSRGFSLRTATLWLGAAVVLLVTLVAVFAPWLAPHDPYAQDLNQRMVPPFWFDTGSTHHLLGTDQLGRDYFSRLLYGARVSLLVGFLTVLISGLIGITLGMLGGFFGGRIDTVVMFIITCRLSVPLILVALTVVALVGNSLLVLVLTLGLLLWERFAVVARTTTMQERRRDYVDAARAAGASLPVILLREVLPNILPHLVVVATLEMAIAILLEASLSFLGLGVPAPLPSWGLMIAEARDFMFFTPWVIGVPGAALATLILAINLMGDGLRDFTGGGRKP